ncbi:MAG: hypothetical protein HKN40_12555 [Winogradskyella sp.]|uniref:hypothetical protein n=1 Tax=Winogradskyella sp. TaxID=1883156 RepID=UPI0018321F5B|nr:hypothetical protein [Winogradskyella sp.]
MKNFGLLLLGIILGALVVYFYCSNNQADMESEPPMLTPKGIISPEQAMVLDSTYNLKHRIINDSLFKKSIDGGDNRSSWWSLEDIQNYINYAENQAGELGYTMDGLRVYLGSYPDEGGKTGLTTMFFIPTGKKNTSKGSIFSVQSKSGDIPGGSGLNLGQNGHPPEVNYPQ